MLIYEQLKYQRDVNQWTIRSRYRRIPGDVCCGGDPVVTGFLDTHQICKNVSWYEYGMDYQYETKFNTRKVSQLG